MFCPNCGTQNDSAATPCKKCGFKLSGISVPKFKGTMMLNSDQTVAEMIEEHRKKQVQGSPADKNKARASEPAPRRSPGSSAPPSSLGGPRGPVLQPPRAAAPSRGRMGGTMLGVAPQVGGHSPPPGSTGTAAPASEPSPAMAPTDGSDAPAARSSRRGSDDRPEAGATPPPASPEPAAPPSEPLAKTRESAAMGPPAETARLAESPAGEAAAIPAAPDDSSPAAAERLASDVAEAPELSPAPPRAVAATRPLPQVSEAVSPDQTAVVPADPKPSSRLSPLDIVLIVCTFGIYGLVLWARQRKPPA